MRVLQINSVCGIGSTGRIATDLYKVLVDNGHECCIAYGRGSAPSNICTMRIGRGIDVYCHGIISRFTDKHGEYSKNATRGLIKSIREYDPDIVHLHNIHGYYINIESLFDYLKESGKPVVWTLHDCWPFTGHCVHFDYIRCEKWKTQCEDCVQIKEYPKGILFDNSFKNYKKKRTLFTSLKSMTIVSPSSWLKSLVEESFLGKFPVNIISNGIDKMKFQPLQTDIKARLNIKEKKIVLGVANVWSPKKGLADFIELSRLMNFDGFQLIMVGVTPIQIIKLPASIIGIPRTESIMELVELYTIADVFLNLTYEDTFPTTNLEAIACGTPVISYNSGGSSETATYLVEKGDIEAVWQLIRSGQYLEHKDLYRVSDCTESAEKYLKLYEKVVNYDETQ